MTVEGGLPKDWLPLLEWSKWFYPRQKEFIAGFEDNIFNAFIAGNGTGKTLLLYWSLMCLTLGIHPHQLVEPPLRVKVLVTSFEQGLEQIARDKLFTPSQMPDGTEIGPLCPLSAVKEMWNKDNRRLELNNGSVIWFMTSEQRRQLHSGTEADALFCDEEPSLDAFDESYRGVRNSKLAAGGRVVMALTPPYLEGQGPSWTKERIVDPFEDKVEDTNITITKAAMVDNPAITKEFIKEFSRGKTNEQLRVQLYGEYPSWGRLIHPTFRDEPWNPDIGEGHILPNDWHVDWEDGDLRFEMAVDWHASKPCAALWSYTDREGNVYVFDELRPEDTGHDATIAEICDAIRRLEGYDRRKVARYIDPKTKDRNNMLLRGFSAWEEFRNNKLFFMEAYNRNPGVGISIVNDFFNGDMKSHPRVFIRENCTNLIRALKNHYWSTNKEQTRAEPDKKWSDYPVCLKYILQNKSAKAKNLRKKKMPLQSIGNNPLYKRYWRK